MPLALTLLCMFNSKALRLAQGRTAYKDRTGKPLSLQAHNILDPKFFSILPQV